MIVRNIIKYFFKVRVNFTQGRTLRVTSFLHNNAIPERKSTMILNFSTMETPQ